MCDATKRRDTAQHCKLSIITDDDRRDSGVASFFGNKGLSTVCPFKQLQSAEGVFDLLPL
jgi:hypothetical protein